LSYLRALQILGYRIIAAWELDFAPAGPVVAGAQTLPERIRARDTNNAPYFCFTLKRQFAPSTFSEVLPIWF
jgi:hypothetical protein